VSLRYVGSVPCRFQYGDRVLARPQSADDWPNEVLIGEVVQAVNRDDRMLNEGKVQVKEEETGKFVWVIAERVLNTAGEAYHPVASERPIAMYEVVCRCGNRSVAEDRDKAHEEHRQHGNRKGCEPGRG